MVISKLFVFHPTDSEGGRIFAAKAFINENDRYEIGIITTKSHSTPPGSIH